jgi:hypothetical protein
MGIRPRRAAGSSVPAFAGSLTRCTGRRRTLTRIALGERVRMISKSYEHSGNSVLCQRSVPSTKRFI